MPPPSVSPPTPVVEMMPPVVASPKGYAAALRSPQVAPPARPRGLGDRVDPHAAHRRQVDHEGVVRRTEAGHAVRPAAHGDGQVVVGREPDRGHHVAGVGRPDDQRRAAVDHGVVDASRVVVLGILGRDDGPPNRLAQCFESSGVHVQLLVRPAPGGDRGVRARHEAPHPAAGSVVGVVFDASPATSRAHDPDRPLLGPERAPCPARLRTSATGRWLRCEAVHGRASKPRTEAGRRRRGSKSTDRVMRVPGFGAILNGWLTPPAPPRAWPCR